MNLTHMTPLRCRNQKILSIFLGIKFFSFWFNLILTQVNENMANVVVRCCVSSWHIRQQRKTKNKDNKVTPLPILTHSRLHFIITVRA